MADEQDTPPGTLGRIALKQVRVSREEADPRTGARSGNPMNALVPYLDLFSRLDDEELSRLARVETEVVAELRRQVDEISRALARYADLLPRLSDAELMRLTSASAKTIRFWRLCQARPEAETSGARPNPAPGEVPRSHSAGGEAVLGVPSHTPFDRTPAPVSTRQATAAVATPATRVETLPPASTPSPRQRKQDEIGDDDIVFALIDDDDEQAVTQAQADAPTPTSSEDEDDLAFELSDDDFY